MVVSGKVRVWGLTDKKRRYIVHDLPFGEARLLYKSEKFAIQSGKGEQREVVPSHARKLKKAMEQAYFVPTVIHVGTRSKHRKKIVFSEQEGGPFAALEMEEKDSLPLINGGHRFSALEMIRQYFANQFSHARTEDDRKKAQAMIEVVDSQPITAIILLDGNAQEDFVYLQVTKTVDAAHMLSLKVTSNAVTDREVEGLSMAFDTARLLNEKILGPFYLMIKFESHGHSPLPVSQLCQKGASDLGTSLVGLARLGKLVKLGETALCELICQIFKYLKEHAPDLIARGQILEPMPDGTKATAGMMIGLGVAMLGRLIVQGKTRAGERDLAQFLAACREKLDYTLDQMESFAQTKRRLLGEFVNELFADLEGVAYQDGLPRVFIDHLSASAFGVKTKQGRKPKDYVPYQPGDNTGEPQEAVAG